MNERINPYVGPRAFETGEMLYGRERELRQLQSLLIAERLVLLHSPSGAGKTSLIQAGLVPALRKREFNVLPAVRVNLEPPSDLPLPENFNRYLYSVLVSLEEPLRPRKRLPLDELLEISLDAYLRWRPRRPADSPSDLLIFDQFEEILTTAPADREGKLAFFNQLGEALRNPDRWALFSMREDYLGALSPYLRPIPGQLEQRYRLDLLGPEAALQAIQNPAREKGVDFTDGAAELLINDLRQIKVQQPDGSFHSEAGSYVEPVQLQVACYNLWQSGAANDLRISRGDVRRIGSVDNALSLYYANSITNASHYGNVEQRLVRQWFEYHLISPDGIRSQVLKGHDITKGLPNKVCDLLEDAHLIRAETRAGKTWYELAHDRLVDPVAKDNKAWFETHLSLLQKQAILWVQQNRPDELLLRGEILKNGVDWAKNHQLTTDEKVFLSASQKSFKQGQLLRSFINGFVVLFLVSVAIFIFSIWAFNQAEARRVTALGEAALAEGNPHLATILALQVLKWTNLQEAQELLIDSTNRIDQIGNNQVLPSSMNNVYSVAWSNDGRLASAGDNGTIIVWDLDKSKPGITLRKNSESVMSIAWSSDGRLVAGDATGTITIWDVENGIPIQTLLGHTRSVKSLAWSQGDKLASGSDDKTVIVWDLARGVPEKALTGHVGEIMSVAWSKDGRLASGSSDGIIIWDLSNGSPAKNLSYQGLAINSISWSSDGRLASTVGIGIAIWDLQSEIPTFTSLSGENLAWYSNEMLAGVSYDGTVSVWSAKTNQIIQSLQGNPANLDSSAWFGAWSVAWSPDGRLASGGGDGLVIVWDIKSRNPVQFLERDSSWISSIAWSRNGCLASGDNSGKVIVWDISTEKPFPAQTFQVDSGQAITAISWSQDDRTAFGDLEGNVYLWNPEIQNSIQILRGHSDIVFSLAWSVNGQLASASIDGTIIIWDLINGVPAITLHEQNIVDIAWSSTGYLAATTGTNLWVWSFANGSPSQIFHNNFETQMNFEEQFIGLSWLTNGNLVTASLNGTVQIWDISLNEPVETLRLASSENKSTDSMGLESYRDERVAVGSQSGVITIWDIPTGRPIQFLKGRQGSANTFAWSPDGRLAIGTSYGTIEIVSKQFTYGPCSWVFKNLSLAEWSRFIGYAHVYSPTCSNLPSQPILFWDTATNKPVEYFLVTWQGRLIALGVLLSIIIVLRLATTQSAWWAGLLIGVGLLLGLSDYFIWKSQTGLLVLLGWIAQTLGFLGLFLSFLLNRRGVAKVVLALGMFIGDVIVLVSVYILVTSNGRSDGGILGIAGFIVCAISLVGWVLWLGFRIVRWFIRRLKSVKR